VKLENGLKTRQQALKIKFFKIGEARTSAAAVTMLESIK
jgi:hypothetical protein